MTTTNVRITISNGISSPSPYAGRQWEGQLGAAPVGYLVPEGIVSARTQEEADRVRSTLAEALTSRDRVVLIGSAWQIEVKRIPAE